MSDSKTIRIGVSMQPEDLKILQAMAKANMRSLSAQIVFLIHKEAKEEQVGR